MNCLEYLDNVPGESAYSYAINSQNEVTLREYLAKCKVFKSHRTDALSWARKNVEMAQMQLGAAQSIFERMSVASERVNSDLETCNTILGSTDWTKARAKEKSNKVFTALKDLGINPEDIRSVLALCEAGK